MGKVYATSIKERNIWYKGRDLEGYNNIINGCLEFYQSKDLKILSKKRYKEVNNKTLSNGQYALETHFWELN